MIFITRQEERAGHCPGKMLRVDRSTRMADMMARSLV
jgi:hypothetical protein